jgi:hypothetical protein
MITGKTLNREKEMPPTPPHKNLVNNLPITDLSFRDYRKKFLEWQGPWSSKINPLPPRSTPSSSRKYNNICLFTLTSNHSDKIRNTKNPPEKDKCPLSKHKIRSVTTKSLKLGFSSLMSFTIRNNYLPV